MIDHDLVEKIKEIKASRHYTLHDLSKKLDIHVSTIERWLQTGRINKVYAQLVREKLNIG